MLLYIRDAEFPRLEPQFSSTARQDTAKFVADTYITVETFVKQPDSGRLIVGLDNIQSSAYLPPQNRKLRSGARRQAYPAGHPDTGFG
jgi:hypothetical protein